MNSHSCASTVAVPVCSSSSNRRAAAVRAAAARQGLFHLACLIFFSVQLPGVHGLGDRVRVATCEGFKAELEKGIGPGEILVEETFSCNRSEWGQQLVVTRNVSVIGTGVEFPAIDWSDSNKVLTAGENVHLTFQHLVFLQDEMGVGGLNIGFFAAQKNASGTFSGIVVGVRSCPETFTPSKPVIEAVPRPKSLPGKQAATVRSGDTLVVHDMGIQWKETKAIWRFCNMIFECGVNHMKDPRLKLLFQDSVVQDNEICPYQHSKDGFNGADNKPSFAAWKVALIALSGAVVLCLSFIIITIWRRKRQIPDVITEQKGKEEPTTDALVDDDHSSHRVAPPALHNWNINLSEVDVGTPLGRGGFAKVCKGCWQGNTVAVKIIRHNDRLLQTHDGEPFEAFLSKHISHPNVIQTYHISTKERSSAGSDRKSDSDCEKGDSNTNQDLFPSFDKEEGVDHSWPVGSPHYETWIVLEYCDLGSLQNALAAGTHASPIKNESQLSKLSDTLQTALEIASAMNYLHSFRIIHGDLKPGNVLLKSDGSQPRGFICKVGDFGLSRLLDDDSHIKTFTFGTVTHMPPELLKGGVLSPAADVYSFGILLWELVTGESPYAGKNQAEIILDVVNDKSRPELPGFIPEEYSSLARDCWHHDHEARPLFPAIIDRIRRMLMKHHNYQNPGFNPRVLMVGHIGDSAGRNGPSTLSSAASGHVHSSQQYSDASATKGAYNHQDFCP